jgi:predicted nucleic acid-binding Zn ribbon protein
MGDDLVRIDEVLDPLGVRMGLGASRDAAMIWSRWSEIVGGSIAHHAEPSSLREGVLSVRADSPTWATELGYLASDIRARANELIGKESVVEVRVWTGPGAIKLSRQRAAAREEERERAPADDPAEAFERARKAWRRWRSKGGSEAP